MKTVFIVAFIIIQIKSGAQTYFPDLQNGQYQNPIIFSDYSDPDVVRVGQDFYMVSSSFNCTPGLPVLHSNDLVNWKIINHVLPVLKPDSIFRNPQHGNGVWAPSIRYYAGYYYVYYGDPDLGIFMIKTKDPAEEWEDPVLVRGAKGWIDPCPLWDDDGNAYLVHAFAGSRAGNKSILVIHRMSQDGTRLLDDGVLVFDGHKNHPTIEGPKLYKRNGFYYIFAPGGGVAEGWQTVLRSKSIYGPYEDRIVLDQGNSDVNGPHQGAWVTLENGEDWFIHFQERQPYGRIVHLQPAEWKNDWIVIGKDDDNDGKGEPVSTWKKPNVGKDFSIAAPQTSDEFNDPILGLQWQWHGNPQPLWLFPSAMGFLRMNPVIVPAGSTLWKLPNLLLQKFPDKAFAATVKFDFHHQNDSEEFGVVIMGRDYASISLSQEQNELFVNLNECKNADGNGTEKNITKIKINDVMYLRVNVAEGGICTFSYSKDGQKYTALDHKFQAREGKWIGAKIGLYSIRKKHLNDGGYTDIDWFRITK